MANYIEISRDSGSTWKKASVFADGSVRDGEPITPFEVDETLDGKVVESVGVSKMRWFYRLKIYDVAPAGFADGDWITSMFRTPGLIMLKPLKTGVVVTGAINNRAGSNKTCLTFAQYGADALYSFDLEVLTT